MKSLTNSNRSLHLSGDPKGVRVIIKDADRGSMSVVVQPAQIAKEIYDLTSIDRETEDLRARLAEKDAIIAEQAHALALEREQAETDGQLLQEASRLAGERLNELEAANARIQALTNVIVALGGRLA